MDYFIKLGIPCYGNQDICDNHKGCKLLPKVLNIGGFKVQNFELVHNVPNNAFIIDTSNGIRILYCTDTQYIPKRVKGVHYAIIECNHDMDFMLDNALEDVYSMSHYENHHSIDNCIEYLKEIYNPNMQGVILWHMSDTNIDEVNAVKKVKKELGFEQVFSASNNLMLLLQKEEF